MSLLRAGGFAAWLLLALGAGPGVGAVHAQVPTPSPGRPSQRSPVTVARVLAEYHQRFPGLTRIVELGLSHEGRPVQALVIGRNLGRPDPRPAVLLNGAHHGGEVLSIDVILDAIWVLLERSTPGRRDLSSDPELDRKVQRYLDSFVIWCVPMVNPDGVWAVLNSAKRSDRKNGRDNNGNGRTDEADGVDLNRNYPFRWGTLGEKGSSSQRSSVYYRGPSAASEPEVQAMVRWAERERPVASVSYHTGTVALLAPYTIPGAADPQPNDAWEIGEWVASRMPPHPQDRTFKLRRNLYPVDGTDQDYLRQAHGTLALLIEAARKSPGSTEERKAIVRVVRRSWTLLLDRFLDGPAVLGTVHDAAGRPVPAEIRIDDPRYGEKEVWTARCRDGQFGRYLITPGTHRVRVLAPGRPAGDPGVVQTLEVGRGPKRLDITLPYSVAASPCPEEPADAAP